jgi:two-component system, cell cycle sensor histidine kinase and response regulator CckA
VVEAPGAEEALRWAERHQGPIHLLVTDVIMPGLSGRQLAERIGTMRPETKILFMSGYTGDIVIRYGLQEMGVEFIQKPFDAESLERKVRALLDEPRD